MATRIEELGILLTAKPEMSGVDKMMAKLAIASTAIKETGAVAESTARQAKAIIESIKADSAAAGLKDAAAKAKAAIEEVKKAVSSEPLRLAARGADSGSATVRQAKAVIDQVRSEIKGGMDSAKREAQSTQQAFFNASSAYAVAARSQVGSFEQFSSGVAKNVRSAFESVVSGLKLGFAVDLASRTTDAIAKGFAFAKESVIGFNSEVEQQEVAFRTLLGSVEAARSRIAELVQFAKDTPFELPQIVQASRVLQSLTGGALAAGEGLRIVGDTAAAISRPLDEVSMWIGRVYAGLKTGTPIGEATLRLIEMGAISGDVKIKLDAMATAGAMGMRAMDVIRDTFGRNSGAMKDQAETFNGQIAILRDNLTQLAAEAGKPIFDNLKTGVELLNKSLEENSNFPVLQTLIEQIKFFSKIPFVWFTTAGQLSGGDVGESNTARLRLQQDALEESIRKTIKAKRDLGEIDMEEAAQLAKRLSSVQQLLDLQERATQGRALAASVGRGRSAAVGPSERSDRAGEEARLAQEKAQGDAVKFLLENRAKLLESIHQKQVDSLSVGERLKQLEIDRRKVLMDMTGEQFGDAPAARERAELEGRVKLATIDRQITDATRELRQIEQRIEEGRLAVTKAQQDANKAFDDFNLRRQLDSARGGIAFGQFDIEAATKAISDYSTRRANQARDLSSAEMQVAISATETIENEQERAAAKRRAELESEETLKARLFEIDKGRIEELDRIQKNAAEARTNGAQIELNKTLDGLARQRAALESNFRLTEIQKRSERIRLAVEERDGLARQGALAREQQRAAPTPEAAATFGLAAQGFEERARSADANVAGLQAEANPQSFRDQFASVAIDIQDRWGSVAQQMASAFSNVFESAIASISQGISGLVLGTLSWGQALQQIGVTILTTIVQSIIQMGVRWIMTQILMATVGKSIQAAMVAANVPLAAAAALTWATPATLATIATYGSAAAAAPGFIGAAQGIVMAESLAGFAAGGYTGDGPRSGIAGVVHNEEVVFDAPSVDRIGLPDLEALRRGTKGIFSPEEIYTLQMSGAERMRAFERNFETTASANPSAYGMAIPAAVGAAPLTASESAALHPAQERAQQRPIQMAFFDSRQDAEKWAQSQQGQTVLIDIAKRSQHEVSG